MQDATTNSPKTVTLAKRLATVEHELAVLKSKIDELASADKSEPAPDDWRKFVGAFDDDPTFEEAVRLGRKWRERQSKC